MNVFELLKRQMAPLVVLCCFVGLGSQTAKASAVAVGDPCSAPTVGTGSGIVGSANGASTCGVIITVTAVDGNGKAIAYTVMQTNPSGEPPNNGNPFDGTEDTLVGVVNSSGANLNSIPLTSTTGALGFDGDGPCTDNQADCFTFNDYTSTGYEGPDNTFAVTDSNHGTVNFITPIPNGGTTWFALEGTPESLTPPTMQVQMTPAATNADTPTTVSTIFNSNTNNHVENDVILPTTGNLTPPCPDSCIDLTTLQFQSNNRFVPDATLYTGGTPFATFVPFDHAGNDALAGTPGNGAKYEVTCADATHVAFSEANCPLPNPNNNPPIHITAKDIFDFPKDGNGNFIQPVIAIGTTVTFLHWAPGTTGVTAWSASNTIPHPACPNVFTSTFNCDLEDILVNKYGASNGYGSDLKKGDYFLGYNVPMLCSAVKANGKPVNTPCVQGNGPTFVHSPVTFDFLVTPAQCPTLPVACGNGWMAAPVDNLFWTFDPLVSAPDLPGTTDLNDLIDCPGTNSEDGATCTVTSVTQPGTSSTLPVEFKTAPVLGVAEGRYLAQWSARDTVRIRERYVTIIPFGSNIPCPNPFPLEGPAPTPPCYSTKLFNAEIDVDNTPPTASLALSLAPTTNNGVANSLLLNQNVAANYSCNDPVSGGVASGVATCVANINGTPVGFTQTGPFAFTSPVSTAATGSFTFTVNTTDVAGNVGAPKAVAYTVVDQPVDLDLFYVAPAKVKPGASLTYLIAAVNLAQKNVASGVTITDMAPAGTTVQSAVFGKVSCSWSGCSVPKTGTACGISGQMITCNIGSLAPLNTLTGVGIVIVVNVPAATPLNTVLSDTATFTSLNRDTDTDNSIKISTTVKNN